jgi:uncharacterized protein (DUF952 family)
MMVAESARWELLEMLAEDMRVRAELERTGRLFRGYDPQMEAVHRRNAARLRELIAEHGWPGRGIAGEDGSSAAWTIAQHAIGEPDFQRRVLPLLEQAAARGEVPAWQPAYLVDRVRMFEGWPQLYGTQMAPDLEGQMAVWPIAQVATLDERRRRVGLPPFEQRRVEPVSKDSADEGRTTRAQMDAWARSIGWRRRILHLATGRDWAAAIRNGAYAAPSLTTEGFIHCSDPHQVIWVANTRFAGRLDLILLHIDANRLTVEGRYENLEGGQEYFPHIYGAINLDAIVRLDPFPPRPDGSFDHDQLAALY